MSELIYPDIFKKHNIKGFFSKRLKDKSELNLKIPVFLNHQIHCDKITILNDKSMINQNYDADAIITNLKDIAIAVKTADCVPIIISDKDKKIASVIHAGWKGTSKEITKKVILKIEKEFKIKPSNLIASIGPAICKNCYSVNEDVINEFKKIIKNDDFYIKNNNRFYIDLKDINKKFLIETGLLKENIELINDCTYCKNNEYQSYRYHKTTLLYQLSYIYL